MENITAGEGKTGEGHVGEVNLSKGKEAGRRGELSHVRASQRLEE